MPKSGKQITAPSVPPVTGEEWMAICRVQRQAYFAWQAAPAGQGEKALTEYVRASAAMKTALA